MTARSTITLSLAALAAALAATPAAAADMSLRGSMPAFEQTGVEWGGFYAGIHAGIGSSSLDVQNAGRNAVARILNGYIYETTSSTQTGASSFVRLDPVRSTPTMFGAFVGYQAQFEDAVVGVEFDYNRVGTGGSSSFSMPAGNPGVVYGASSTGYQIYRQNVTTAATLHDYVTARLRAGWAYGRIMPYMTGGLALARGTVRTDYNSTLDTCSIDTSVTPNVTTCTGPMAFLSATSTSRNAIGVGLAGGVGVDALLANNIFLRAEYQYLRVPSIAGVGVTLHTVRAGVGIKY
jgi:outer membrane immunogenic protein